MSKHKHIDCSAFWKQAASILVVDTPESLAMLKLQFGVEGEILPITTSPGYAVSSCGRVFSRMPCAWLRDVGFREMKLGVHAFGYRFVRLHVNKRPSSNTVHRLVAIAFLPAPEPHQAVVRHLDGDPSNNNVGNLAWGTQADNMADCVRHGRTLRGIKNTNAKLNPKRVALIRGLHEEGFGDQTLAAFFGVGRETVRRAVTGEHWSHEQA